MDLEAYAQIGSLGGIAKDNGIDIPRLRGYRLMRNEKPIPKETVDEDKKACEIYAVIDLCQATPFWNPNSHYHTSSCWTDYLCDYYLTTERVKENIWHAILEQEVEHYSTRCIGIRWDRIHGWKRRVLKFEIKKRKRKIQQQYDIWNKYAGQENVLYIHSRMGGNNWKYWLPDMKTELMNQPWFLDRVDDWWDSTYCDFYATISPESLKKYDDFTVNFLKEEYKKSEIVMSEFLRAFDDLDLTVKQKRELMEWSGDDNYMMVTDDGEILTW